MNIKWCPDGNPGSADWRVHLVTLSIPMMIRWWLNDDQMMIKWISNDDQIMIKWWSNEYQMMIKWWSNDDQIMIKWWSNECQMMIRDQITGAEEGKVNVQPVSSVHKLVKWSLPQKAQTINTVQLHSFCLLEQYLVIQCTDGYLLNGEVTRRSPRHWLCQLSTSLLS